MKQLPLVFVALGLALLAALFVWMKPAPETPPSPPAPAPIAAAEPAPLPAAPAVPVTNDYVVRGGQRISGPEVIRVKQGEDVHLSVSSDKADELHLHGYDLHLHVHAGEPARLSFKAEHSGRFELELHKSHVELGNLEVMPADY